MFPEHISREPQTGDVYEWTTPVETLGKDKFFSGDRMTLKAPTQKAPFNLLDPHGGNWIVEAKGKLTVWSSIRQMIHMGYLLLVSSDPVRQTVWEMLNNDDLDGTDAD